MRRNKFPVAVPWVSPTLNSWRCHRSPTPNRTELEFLLCWTKNCAGRRNGRAPIWRRRIRSIFVSLPIKKELDYQLKQWNWKHVNTILIWEKITVNHFHLCRSFDGKESAQFMSHSLKIRTRRWHSANVNNFPRPGCCILKLIYSSRILKFLFILPFNILVKSAMADFVLINSVIVKAKFLVAVSKLFEVSGPFYLNWKFIERILKISNKFISGLASQIFFHISFSDFYFMTNSLNVDYRIKEIN